MPRVYPSNERERRVVRSKDLSVKQLQKEQGKTIIKAASTFCPPDGGKQHTRARDRVRRGCLLDEGAD